MAGSEGDVMIRRVKVADVIDHNVERASLRVELLDQISGLPERERSFIERHYINGETYREISTSADICHQRVRQITEHGLSRLRREIYYGRM
jgi:RNA polymerase sigma factor (sigma-70 family)